MIKKLISIIAVLAVITIAFAQSTETLKLVESESSVKWLGEKVTGKHWGTVKFKEGTLRMMDNKIVTGTFIVDLTTIIVEDIEDPETNAKLLGHLKSDDFFNVEKYPTAKFEITKSLHNNFAKGDAPNYTISGNLTIRDKTHPITVQAHIDEKGDMIHAKTDLTFDRSKYDIKFGSGSFFDNLGDKTIYDDVKLTLDVVAKK